MASPASLLPLTTLGDFAGRVAELRREWAVPPEKELWFRGERRKYTSFLRPVLYRPAAGTSELKPVGDLLELENMLYEGFQRTALQLSTDIHEGDDWDWDSYNLMQHHGAPTRLLDWSDGALMALHFAVRDGLDDGSDAVVYVVEPYRLKEVLEAAPGYDAVKSAWDAFVEDHPSQQSVAEEWERAYLPGDKSDLAAVPIPEQPLLLWTPHFTRRAAAQRSEFMVFGTDYNWLTDRFESGEEWIQAIGVAAGARADIRQQLRDCGVTESVIFPDLDGLGRELRQLWDELH